jgi:hypothetical protein
MVNIELLQYELTQAGLPVESVHSAGEVDYSRELTQAEQATAAQVIAAHNPAGKFPWVANADNVRARFLASALAKKTPAEIYTLMQGRIDGWSSLAAAKADLREWIPLLAAALAWLNIEQR